MGGIQFIVLPVQDPDKIRLQIRKRYTRSEKIHGGGKNKHSVVFSFLSPESKDR